MVFVKELKNNTTADFISISNLWSQAIELTLFMQNCEYRQKLTLYANVISSLFVKLILHYGSNVLKCTLSNLC